MTTHLSEYARSWNVDILDLVQVASRIGVSRTPSFEEEEALRSALLQEFAPSDEQQRELYSFLTTKASGKILEAREILPRLKPKEQESYLSHLATLLLQEYALQGGKCLPQLVMREAVTHHLALEDVVASGEPVTNCGVVPVHRTSGMRERPPLPAHLLHYDKTIAGREVRQDLIRALQRHPVHCYDDLASARNTLYDVVESLHSACDAGSSGSDALLAHQVVDAQAEHLEKIISFGQRFLNNIHASTNHSPPFHPSMHQIIRIHEAVYNGARRILCADSTSAGKTFTATAIKGCLDKRNIDELGRGKTKALIVAPDQALGDAWNEKSLNGYLNMIGLVPQRVVKLERGTTSEELALADIILVNYAKLSLQTVDDTEREEPEANRYVAQLLAIADRLDMVIVDECHNLKNPGANRSVAFRDIVEKTKKAHTVLLSATPVPNRLQDAGFLLYMLDPDVYAHYAATPYDYSEDPYSIANAVRSGHWFTFTREELKVLHNLPELVKGVPALGIPEVVRFSLSQEQEREYFESWKREASILEKLSDLSRIQLEAAIPEIVSLVKRISARQPDAQYIIFSQRKEGFAEKILGAVENIPGIRASKINGDIPLDERLGIASSFRDHSLNVVVNTYATMSEAISLATRTTPVYVIFAEPPLVPATREQSEGRSYRTMQELPVHVLELVSRPSASLERLMCDEKTLQESRGIKYRSTWTPTTTFHDRRNIRLKKQIVQERALNAQPLGEETMVADVTEHSEAGYSSLPQTVPQLGVNERFMKRVNKVRPFIGKGVERLAKSSRCEELVQAYCDDDIERTASGDTNRALVQVIHALEQESPIKNILDWGSGPACLARQLLREGDYRIANLDVLEAMLRKGQEVLKGDPRASFHLGDARAMPFKDESFDLVASSYALQYNMQGVNGRRDVEDILRETCRVLRPEGYSLFALPRAAVRPEDVERLVQVLLPAYGFNVQVSATPQGFVSADPEAEKNFEGFHLLLGQKHCEEPSRKQPYRISYPIIICPPYALVGVGGTRPARQRRKKQSRNGEKLPATHFRVGLLSLQDIVKSRGRIV